MNYLAIFILWLHVVAGVVWIGGMIFTLMSLFPYLGVGATGRSPLVIEQLRLFQNAQTRFHFLAARAAEIIVLTGIFNILMRGYYSQFTFSSRYMGILTLKILLLSVMITIRIINSRAVVSKIGDYLSNLPPAKQFTDQVPESIIQLQKKSKLSLMINTILGLVAVFLALMLRSL
jgi:uncharacterized membrane protein